MFIIITICDGQVNDKGQLRLSRRALMPDPKPENANTKQKTDDSEESSTSPKSSDLDGPKKVMMKDELESSEGSTISPRSSSPEQTMQPQKKVIKKTVSPAKDRPYVNKDRAKKSGTKAVSSISTKDGTTLVNGEAKIG